MSEQSATPRTDALWEVKYNPDGSELAWMVPKGKAALMLSRELERQLTAQGDGARLADELEELISDPDAWNKRDPAVIPAETAERIVAALRAPAAAGDGWKFAPKQPTEEMVDAGAAHVSFEDDDSKYTGRGRAIACFIDMLAAAPSPPLAAPGLGSRSRGRMG